MISLSFEPSWREVKHHEIKVIETRWGLYICVTTWIRGTQQSYYLNWSLHEQETHFIVHCAKPLRSKVYYSHQHTPYIPCHIRKIINGEREASSGGSSCKTRIHLLGELLVGFLSPTLCSWGTSCQWQRNERGLPEPSLLGTSKDWKPGSKA